MKNLFGEGENEVHFESKYHARNSAKRVDRRKDADLNELPTPSATDVRWRATERQENAGL